MPSALVGAVAASAALAAVGARRPLVGLTSAYIAASAAAAALAATKAGKARLTPAMLPAFACLHAGYGIGMWQGLWRFSLRPTLGRTRIPWSRAAEHERVVDG